MEHDVSLCVCVHVADPEWWLWASHQQGPPSFSRRVGYSLVRLDCGWVVVCRGALTVSWVISAELARSAAFVQMSAALPGVDFRYWVAPVGCVPVCVGVPRWCRNGVGDLAAEVRRDWENMLL